MGKPVNSSVNRVETASLHQKINKELLDNFKDSCKYLGYPMNVMLETFMRQYSNGRFKLSDEDILKWEDDDSELGTLGTTFNKEIYTEFKAACKDNGFFVKYVITAFMEKFESKGIILEYVDVLETEE